MLVCQPADRLMPLDAGNPKFSLAKARLAQLFQSHDLAALAFSGGADSSVLLHLCRPYRDRVTVLWCNPGPDTMLPHMEQFVRETASAGPFVELRPDLEAYWKKAGLPSEVVPVAHMAAVMVGGTYTPQEPKLQAWPACCFALRTAPMFEWLAKHPEVTLLLHGQREVDKATIGEADTPNLAVRAPLSGWSNEDVAAYVAEHDIALPRHYAEGLRDSFECWICPAQSDAGAPARMAYLKQHYPQLYRQLMPVVERVNDAVQGAARQLGERARGEGGEH